MVAKSFIVKLQGMHNKLWAFNFQNMIIVPVSHIESTQVVADPANIQARRCINVTGTGMGSFKVGDFLYWNRIKEENRLLFWDIHHKQAAIDGKVIAVTSRDERYNELVVEVDDDESENVMEELQAAAIHIGRW